MENCMFNGFFKGWICVLLWGKFVTNCAYLFPKITDIQAFKSIKVQNEIVVGLVKNLEEVKRPCFAAKLATKNVLLTIAISSNG